MAKNITEKSGILAHGQNTVLGKNITMHVYQHIVSILPIQEQSENCIRIIEFFNTQKNDLDFLQGIKNMTFPAPYQKQITTVHVEVVNTEKSHTLLARLF
jgi:hypothetical protein